MKGPYNDKMEMKNRDPKARTDIRWYKWDDSTVSDT